LKQETARPLHRGPLEISAIETSSTDTGSSTHRPPILAAVGMCALGFVLAAALLHAAIGDTLRLHADLRSEKLAILDQWQGKAASAAFGSSHVHNGFDPRVFDGILAGTPLQTRSINLGIAGGSQSEQRVTALEYLRHMEPPARSGTATESRACIVLLELNAGANFTTDHLVHPRAINIYDWQTARFETRLTDPAMGLRQKIGRIGFALAAMTLHYVNVGTLSSTIFAPSLDTASLESETEDDRRGVLQMEPSPATQARLRGIVASRPARSVATPQDLLPGNRDLLDELQRASPVGPIQFVYFIMPRLDDMTSYATYPDSIAYTGGTAPILNLGLPDRYPQLYVPKLWLDDAHLNPAGAALATSLLAQDLKSWTAAHGAPARCGG
jgi:hypothetical protein